MTHSISISRLSDFDEQGGCLLYMNCKINGKKAVLIIDTGASRTVIDETSFNEFTKKKTKTFVQKNIKTAGVGSSDLTSKLTILEEIQIKRLHITDCQVFITNLSNINTILDGKLHIDGIFGNDFLVKYNAVIDYGKNKMRLVGLTQ